MLVVLVFLVAISTAHSRNRCENEPAAVCAPMPDEPRHDERPEVEAQPALVGRASRAEDIAPGVAGANARMMMHEASRKRRAWADEPELWTRRNEPLYALLAHRQAAEKA